MYELFHGYTWHFHYQFYQHHTSSSWQISRGAAPRLSSDATTAAASQNVGRATTRKIVRTARTRRILVVSFFQELQSIKRLGKRIRRFQSILICFVFPSHICGLIVQSRNPFRALSVQYAVLYSILFFQRLLSVKVRSLRVESIDGTTRIAFPHTSVVTRWMIA